MPLWSISYRTGFAGKYVPGHPNNEIILFKRNVYLAFYALLLLKNAVTPVSEFDCQ